MILTDKWFNKHGFDTTKEPFISPSGAKKIYKNYIRDASGRYDGYLVEHVVVTRIDNVEDLINLRN